MNTQAPTVRRTPEPLRTRLLDAVVPAVVVGALAALWINLSTRPVTVRSLPAANAPALAFLADPPAESAGADPRLVRSPALYALPTRIGFSGPALTRSVNVVTIPESKPPPPPLQPAPIFLAGAFGETSQELTAMVSTPRPLGLPVRDAQPAPSRRPTTTLPALLVYWQDQPAEPVIDEPLTAIAIDPGPLPWEAIFYLCADPDDWNVRVLVEKPAPVTTFNEAAIRQLRAWSTAHPLTPCRRLVVRYRPPRKEG